MSRIKHLYVRHSEKIAYNYKIGDRRYYQNSHKIRLHIFIILAYTWILFQTILFQTIYIRKKCVKK